MGNPIKKNTKRALLTGATVAALLAVSAVGSASAAEDSFFGVKAQNANDESVSAVRGLSSATPGEDGESTPPVTVPEPTTEPSTPVTSEPTTPPVTEEPSTEPTPEAPDFNEIFKDVKIVSFDKDGTRILKISQNPADVYTEGKVAWNITTNRKPEVPVGLGTAYSGTGGSEVKISIGGSYLRLVIFVDNKAVYAGPVYDNYLNPVAAN